MVKRQPQRRRPPAPRGERDSGAMTSLIEAQRQRWQRFFDQHADRLTGEAQYSLPDALIRSLNQQVRGLLTREDIAFERQFHAAASFGMFLGQPLGEARDPLPAEQELNEATRAAAGRIQAMLEDNLESQGVPEFARNEANTIRQRAFNVSSTKRTTYVGWLMSQMGYRQELGALRAAGAATITTWGRFPTRTALQQLDRAQSTEPFAMTLLSFYTRWSLERLLTWEWPIPLHLVPFSTLHPAQESGSGAGISLFLPWSILQGQQLAADQLLEALKTLSVPAHLRDWVTPPKNTRKRTGVDSYELRASLYRYYWLGLRRRYSARFQRRQQIIDEAFAGWLKREQDTITRCRNQLERILNAAKPREGATAR